MIESLEGARDSVLMTVYSLNAGASGILQALERCLLRGVEIKVLLDSEGATEDAERLLARLSLGPGGECLRIAEYIGGGFENLHAKAIAVDGRLGIVGSANLTRRGLSASHELGVAFDGEEAQNLYALLLELFRRIEGGAGPHAG
jgi:phosphatidylserine/phosphatidylglycerophosphate/cardiolipin synthase-like enzyme